MKNFAVLFGIVAVLYIAMVGVGACAAKPLSQVLHGPAPIVHEYNTYDNSRETHILSDNTVKFFSDLEAHILSDNPKTTDSNNTYATTNNTTNHNQRSGESSGGALVFFGMVAILAVAVASATRP